jgi:hypothetical protein
MLKIFCFISNYKARGLLYIVPSPKKFEDLKTSLPEEAVEEVQQEVFAVLEELKEPDLPA